MATKRAGVALLALSFALTAGIVTPASAEFFGCNDRTSVRYSSPTRAPSHTRSYAQARTQEFAAQSRARITVYPRSSPGRNAVRQCRSTLVKEHRISGTVIVPKTHCWWE
jgi:hypothetical protein